MKQVNDLALISQVLILNRKSAFDTLVKEYQESIRRFFLNLTTGDKELSDDLSQETFIKAYLNLKNFKNFLLSQLGCLELHIMFFMIIFAAKRRQNHLIATRCRLCVGKTDWASMKSMTYIRRLGY